MTNLFKKWAKLEFCYPNLSNFFHFFLFGKETSSRVPAYSIYHYRIFFFPLNFFPQFLPCLVPYRNRIINYTVRYWCGIKNSGRTNEKSKNFVHRIYPCLRKAVLWPHDFLLLIIFIILLFMSSSTYVEVSKKNYF